MAVRLKIKRTIIAFFIILIVLPNVAAAAQNSVPEINSETAAVLNLETEKILYSKNLKGIVYPASLVKIMTAVLAIEYFEEQGGSDFNVTITEDMLKNIQGNKINLKAGEVMSFQNLLYALIVGSANDAAYVLAQTVAGSAESFVKRMNDKAVELGALKTSYANPTGYHSAYMTTTCEDMLKICQYAYKNNTFMQMASLPSYVIEPTNLSSKRTLTSQNLALNRTHWENYYIPGAMGMNAGSTVESGYCFATVLEKKGVNNLVIVIGGKLIDKRNTSFLDAEALLEYTHEHFKNITVLKKNSTVCEVAVELASGIDHTILVTSSDITSLLPDDINIERDIKTECQITDTVLTAPITTDVSYGTLKAYYKGEYIGSADIVSQANIERSTMLYLLHQGLLFLKRSEVKLVLIILAIVLIILLIISILISYIVAKKRMKRAKRIKKYRINKK